MVLEQLNIRRALHRLEQRRLDLVSGEIMHVQNAPFGVPSLPPEVELAMTGNIALVEMQSELHQLADALRTFPNDCPDHLRIAQPGAGFDPVANVQIELIF